jgi:hypothetical protein
MPPEIENQRTIDYSQPQSYPEMPLSSFDAQHAKTTNMIADDRPEDEINYPKRIWHGLYAITVLSFLHTACDDTPEKMSLTPDMSATDVGADFQGSSEMGPPPSPDANPDPSLTVTPVFVTVAGHIEDRLRYQNCEFYGPKRDQLLRFADRIESSGIAFNLQVSYEWLLGVQKCETDRIRESTNGLNILDFLAEEHGFEIDIHQEGASTDDAESNNNFADIRYLAGEVTPHITETTGFQWDNPTHYSELQAGQTGLLHPSFTWRPNLLAGGASIDHTHGDFSRDMTSIGVWIPSDFSADGFHEHDTSAEARMIYVGSGPNQHCADWGPERNCHFRNTAEYVQVLTDYIASGRLEAGRIYTTTLFVPQAILFAPDRHEDLIEILNQLQPLATTGRITYAHFTEVIEIWKTEYNAEPNIVQYDRIDPSDYTCPQ